MTSFFPFFLSFSFSSLSLLYLHFSYFCHFSLLMSELAVCNSGHPTLLSCGYHLCVYSVLCPWFKSRPTNTICIVLSVVGFIFSVSQTRSPWLPSTSLAIHFPPIILLFDASNLRYRSASLNKPHINEINYYGKVDGWMSHCYLVRLESTRVEFYKWPIVIYRTAREIVLCVVLVQTLPDLRNSLGRSGASRNSVYVWSTVHTYKRESRLYPCSGALETDRLQRERCAACVIAQQYSSTTFFSLLFQHRMEKFGSHFKNVISFSSTFLKQLKSVTK
jgi:hypothetical protein